MIDFIILLTGAILLACIIVGIFWLTEPKE